MSLKVLVDNVASLREFKMLPDTKKTYELSQADIIINPNYGILFHKLIILNLATEVPLGQLMIDNQVISRFPIGYGIPVVPYSMPENRSDKDIEDYSCLILNESMLTDMRFSDKSKLNYLVGIDETIEGDATIIGISILKNKVEDLNKL